MNRQPERIGDFLREARRISELCDELKKLGLGGEMPRPAEEVAAERNPKPWVWPGEPAEEDRSGGTWC